MDHTPFTMGCTFLIMDHTLLTVDGLHFTLDETFFSVDGVLFGIDSILLTVDEVFLTVDGLFFNIDEIIFTVASQLDFTLIALMYPNALSLLVTLLFQPDYMAKWEQISSIAQRENRKVQAGVEGNVEGNRKNIPKR